MACDAPSPPRDAQAANLEPHAHAADRALSPIAASAGPPAADANAAPDAADEHAHAPIVDEEALGIRALPAGTIEARLHRRAGRLGMARATFEAGWHAHRSPEVALIIGVLYQRARAHSASLRWLARAEIPALSDFIAFRIVRSAAAAGDATNALHAAERISPTSRFAPHANAQVASALMQAGRPLDAARWLTRATDADVCNASSTAGTTSTDMPPKTTAALARAWAAARQPEQAIRAWRRVALRAGRGAERKRAERAVRRLRWSLPRARWRALTPDPDAHVLAARADMDAHAYRDAEARMLGALQSGIANPTIECDTWWLLARARSRLRVHGDAAPAYARFAEACGDDPRAPSARFAEARAWFTVNDADAALRVARSVWQRWPQHRLADDARLLAARVHLAAREAAEARDLLRALLWYSPHSDVASDAAWLLRQVGHKPPPVQAHDRAHVGRLAYFEGVDLLAAGARAKAQTAWQRAWHTAPNGYYGLLAQLRLRSAGLPAPVATDHAPRRMLDDPKWAEGKALLSLGFAQDAWWAFDAVGPHPLEPGRFAAAIADLLAQHGHHGMALRMFERDVSHLDGRVMDARNAAWFDAVYPLEHVDIFEKWAEHHDLPVALLLALAHTESRFNPKARSWAGACGIMQLVPATAADLARKEGVRGRMSCRRLRNVDLSVRLAARYLSDLRSRFGKHVSVLAAAYNAGPGNVADWARGPRPPFDVWVEQIPFHQARRYVKRVLAAMTVYAQRRSGVLPAVAFDW